MITVIETKPLTIVAESEITIQEAQLFLDDVIGTTGDTVVSDEVSFAYYVSQPYLTAEENPVLARIWDNDDDAIFDTM